MKLLINNFIKVLSKSKKPSLTQKLVLLSTVLLRNSVKLVTYLTILMVLTFHQSSQLILITLLMFLSLLSKTLVTHSLKLMTHSSLTLLV